MITDFTYLKVDTINDSLEEIRNKRILAETQIEYYLQTFNYQELYDFMNELSDTFHEMNDTVPKKITPYISYREQEMILYIHIISFINDLLETRSMYNRFCQTAKDYEIMILDIAYQSDDVLMKGLSDKLGKSKTTVTKYTNRMISDGLLKSCIDNNQGRQRLYSLTARGKSLYEYIQESAEIKRRLVKLRAQNSHAKTVKEKIFENTLDN